MKEILIEELRELQMQILDYVDAFCRKHDIKYTISGGTLLGAVRHGGFIPWDDDIDIQMLRSEYEKFILFWNVDEMEHPYIFTHSESKNNMGYPFGKISNPSTITYIKNFQRTGVFIDVFPVDNVIDNTDFSNRHNHIVKLYRLRSHVFSLLSIFPNSYLLNTLYNHIAIWINGKAKLKENEDCEFVFEMISGLVCKSPIPKTVFNEYQDIKFENRCYMSVANYHSYLVNTFGDYMQLPPKEKQISSHIFKSYWK